MDYAALPIGVEDFCLLREKNYYYIDKTLMIKDLLDNGSMVTLFTRPRRFGKTLNMSMLRYFFEKPYEDIRGETKSYKHLFEGLKIMSAGERYTSEQGQYPVISLTLKSTKQPSFESAYAKLKRAIAGEFVRHEYLLKTDLMNNAYKNRFSKIMNEEADYDEYSSALAFLSECLHRYYDKRVIVLIDEYDVPLENAYFCGFYDEMISFIRSLFESVLKTNPNLEFAVITGCLRIGRESIFTGLNNFKVMTITAEKFSEYFGFTEPEVDAMLESYKIEPVKDIVKKWYDGYMFGGTEIYNPWSILNFVDEASVNINALPVSAWSNTSSNSIVKDLIRKADNVTKSEVECLMQGEAIEKTLHEEITYDSIQATDDNLWNFLLATGYLRVVDKRLDEYNNIKVKLKIPNTEISMIYQNEIITWFKDEIKATDLTRLYNAMLDADSVVFQEEVGKLLSKSISFHDNKEAFYHGFLLGIMTQLPDFVIKSNRESGSGRYDLAVYSEYRLEAPVYILEFKLTKELSKLDEISDRALEQIYSQNYKDEFEQAGYRKFVYYGIGFYKKTLRIKVEMVKL